MKVLGSLTLFIFLSISAYSQSLHTAVSTNNLDLLKKYIKKYGINYPEDQHYPLVAAAKYGRLEQVKYLIENGADINAREYKKRTALLYAINNDHLEIAKYLLGHQPDLLLRDYKSKTALEIAHEKGHYKKLKKYITNNPFVEVDGPYIYKKGKSYNCVSIIKDENGKVAVKEKSIAKSDQAKATCYDTDGKAMFDFKIIDKPKPEKESEFIDVEKIVSISDIEGHYDEFVTLLKASKVMNENYEWIYGKGHLVLLGDFFDRGSKVTECLWLIYHLEQLAEEAGGKVHFLIGNHEEMNLRGQHHYVNFKYVANADFMGTNCTAMIGRNTVLGKWLRKKNAIVKINGNLFVHGGISPEFAKKSYSLHYINTTIRGNLDRGQEIRCEQEAPREIFNTKTGPLWYRGLVKNILSQKQVEGILKTYKADRIIIGHCPVEKIKTYHNNLVIDIDVKHSLGNTASRALLIKDGKYYIIGEGVKKKLF